MGSGVEEIDESSGTVPVAAPLHPSPEPSPTWPTWFEILTCSGYPTQIFISYALMLAGVSPQTAEGQLSGRFVLALSLIDTVALLSLIVLFIRRRGQRAREVFFGNTRPMRELLAGAISLPTVIVILLALTLIIRRFAPSLHNVPDNPLEGLLGSQFSLWTFLLVVIVAGGIREELQRAFLLQRFRDDLGQPWLGLFITSLAFGMGHTLQGFDAALITGTLGAFWGFMYLTRGGALASVTSHSLFNSGELLRLVLK
jgi:membrane protease YdiL (CAAX protease family)